MGMADGEDDLDVHGDATRAGASIPRKNTTWNVENAPGHSNGQPRSDGISSKEEEGSGGPRRSFTRAEYFTLISIASVEFTSMMTNSVLVPFFPEEAAKKGATETVVGLIFGVFSLVQLLFSLLLGKYMVKIGVKFTFLSGLLASGTCTILFGLLDEAPSGRIFIALCFLLHGVDAVGCAASMTASFTILMSMFPHNISTTIGFLELLAGLGLVMGPPLGGFLYEAWGYRMTLIIVGVFMLLTIPVILAALPPQVLVGSSGSFIRLLSLPSVIVVALLICCVDSSMGFFDPNISLFLFEQFNLSSGKIGLVFMSLCISYSVSCPVVGYVSDRRPQWMRCMMLAGAFVSGICFCLLGPVPILHIHTQLWLVVVVLAVLGVSIATAIVPTFSEILLMATNNGFEVGLGTLGLVSGICNGLMSFGNFIGPTLGGLLDDYVNFKWAATMEGLLLILAAFLMLAFYSYECISENRHRQTEELLGDVEEATRPLLS
ncbi:MFS-type transporter SLC18B1-like isoform X1 [Lethenteron reissneri]|uniref:MFS-type transporter SLC18B1-like isoform X1 n=2 Tax=Lethenteron reissneri TaxID=7753 RepID=UPI002AB6FB2A|nr:MFS-type transporter SLC18B1-like isoform X1 [Lethenteron reissneri]